MDKARLRHGFAAFDPLYDMNDLLELRKQRESMCAECLKPGNYGHFINHVISDLKKQMDNETDQ